MSATTEDRADLPYVIEELRLHAFKSFSGISIPLEPLTVFIGRNASGKSNALDGLVVMSRLASGDDLRDALDGSRLDAEPIRGGADGCVPFGADSFSLGCRVRNGTEAFEFDVEIGVRPELRIIRENLRAGEGVIFGKKEIIGRDLMITEPVDSQQADLSARIFNGKRGSNPATRFSSNRLIISQLPLRVAALSPAGELLHRAATVIRAALRDVFVLDPVPHLMRQYVNHRDIDLRRNAENLSAAVLAVQRNNPSDFYLLEEILRAMPERPFVRIGSASSDLGDVMLTLDEGSVNHPIRVPARQMSDGMLRFLSFGTALLSTNLVDAPTDTGVDTGDSQRTLVLEEVENGLHPTMAARVVDLVKVESRRRRVRTIVTTHSPALLNALKGDDHPGVIVFDRTDEGGSRARKLVDLPGYAELMAAGGLGTAVSTGGLAEATRPRSPMSDEFAEFLASL